MSEAILTRPTTTARGSWLSRLARKAVLSRLEGLTRDRLIVREDETTCEFGPGGGLRAEIRVDDPRFYRKLAAGGGLGAAEAWLDGWWTSPDPATVFRIVLRNREVLGGLEHGKSRLGAFLGRLSHRLRRNTRSGSARNISDHYDLGNDLFRLFLDETMMYSSGVFPRPDATLGEAQTEKLDRLCEMLELGPDDHLLEIGTGWGGLAIHAAGKFGARVTTTTISREQYDLARKRIADAGLEDRIEVLLRDYRDLEGQYDKLVSIEMIEAVGHEFLDEYFAVCGRLLRPGGRMALQAITMPDRGYERYLRSVDFIQRYVFPGSCLPSLGSMVASTARATDLRVSRVEDIGPHYAETLRHWRHRFFARIDEVRALGYPERFIRLWEFYLTYCEAGFEERAIGDLQIVLTRPGGAP